MLDRLLPLIPADAKLYAEVFCGGAALLLAKPRHRVEILNDINGDLVALMRNAQRHPEALIEALGWAVLSRQDFFDRMAHPGVTEIERAAALRRLKGRWLLTVNDSPANRALFAGCTIRPVATKNGKRKSTSGGTNATFGELIIAPA